MIPSGLLPSYLADAFGELYQEDGLMCLGKGLQCLMLLATFCRFYADTESGHASLEETPDKGPLVIVLGLKDNERTTLLEILQSWGTPTDQLPTMITNESGQSKDRTSLYSAGGIFCITSRILIVDLLTSTIQSKDIDGILVAHAHTVTEQSTEAFILRIFHNQNPQGFVKGFSDAAERLMMGFAKVDKTLKSLQVRKLFLYPRFHTAIRDELEANNCISVTELHQSMSKQQKEIQNAIAVLVLQCLRQLRQATEHLVSWSNEGKELSVENCVTQQFDIAVSRQLEPHWHRLTPSTKQLVQDLRTLRTLFHALLTYDCVSFWKLLNSIRTMSAASRNPSLWLLEAGADALFRTAKARVYNITQPPPTPNVPEPVSILRAVLEENPKWKLLQSVLDEIKTTDNERKAGNDEGSVRNILVMVKDNRALDAVRSYLTDGKKKTLQLRWLRFLEHCNDRSRSVRGNLSEESRLLLEEETRIRRILFGKHDKREPSKQTKQLNQVPAYMRKKRRIAAEKGRGEKSAEDLRRQAVLEEAVEETEQDLQNTSTDNLKRNSDGIGYDSDEEKFRVSYPSNELRVVIRSFANTEGDRAHLLLQDIQPKYVVLYDSELAFIRAVEIYAALRAQPDQLKVFFLMFEASAEEKNFKKSLEREQNAFERLIHHKKTMPEIILQNSTATQEMQQAGGGAGSYMGGSLPLAVDTRRAKKEVERRDIAVDVREFRSALPSILHQGGMRLAPVTLVVGDFVLSQVHCVERKSISDLFGSFASGRLYNQAEAMCKYFKCPCLLIEFDPKKSFCLQNSNELGVEIRMDSICSKMALLTMHFPKLRVLWSRSPHDTLKIFKDLKSNHEEVDVARAVENGKNDAEEYLLDNGEDDEVNEVARDMLLRLPGVNVHVARKIMAEVDSLADLFELSRDELRRIAGPVVGQKLFTFFRQKMAAT